MGKGEFMEINSYFSWKYMKIYNETILFLVLVDIFVEIRLCIRYSL